jgi:PemK-like, MazF-like toxin of type II toxin-antitoxin system
MPGRIGSLFNRVRSAVRPTTAPASEKQTLKISYSPHGRNGVAEPGEVVWTWVPFEDDPKQGKDRPVLVIGTIGKNLAALPLTSKDHDERRDVIELGTGSWDSERRVSYVKLDQLLTVPPKKVRREGGTLEKDRFDHVVAELRQYHAEMTRG